MDQDVVAQNGSAHNEAAEAQPRVHAKGAGEGDFTQYAIYSIPNLERTYRLVLRCKELCEAAGKPFTPYELTACHIDTWHYSWDFAELDWFAKHILEANPEKQRSEIRMLDIGAGTGCCSRFMGYKYGFHTTQFEYQPDVVNLSRQISSLFPEINTDFQCGDFFTADIPTEEDKYDAAMIVCVLIIILNKREFLQQACRMLKVGGLLCIEAFLRYDEPLDEVELASAIHGNHAPEGRLHTLEEFVNMIESVPGFSVERVQDVTTNLCKFAWERAERFANPENELWETLSGCMHYQAAAQNWRQGVNWEDFPTTAAAMEDHWRERKQKFRGVRMIIRRRY